MIRFEVTDNTGFAELSATIIPRVSEAIRHNAAQLESQASAAAPRGTTRRPGKEPYADTITTHYEGPLIAEVGTDAPYGYRLEQGFHGADALDRHYQQDGQPHFGPAHLSVEQSLLTDLETVLDTEPGAFIDRLR